MFALLALTTALSWGPAEEWDGMDTALMLSLSVVSAYDTANTEWCLKNHLCYEGNMVLGANPSSRRVWITFGVTQLVLWGVAIIVPPLYRKLVESVVLGVETINVLSKTQQKYYTGGLKVAF